MKIQCDVCETRDAAVFCAADEAALCDGCDRRVHRANKFASKHPRFPLLHPSSMDAAAPHCDICQERRAFLFCLEDRAILCTECDVSIHRANEHTQSHSRFLLTFLKLSPSSANLDAETTTSEPSIDRGIAAPRDRDSFRQPSSNSIKTPLPTHYRHMSEDGAISTGNQIPEFCMELPFSSPSAGWRLEDFFDSTSGSQPLSNCMVCRIYPYPFSSLLFLFLYFPPFLNL
ncbi:hypothetical protein Dimus_026023 [Dionaea muscipula]